MKEHPIIFSTDMVRAILDGKKTMTRRVIKNPERYEHIRECDFCCPYGQVGDRLWVRETLVITGGRGSEYVAYKADGYELDKGIFPEKWRPSIFMPRWASRITLEITEVRVERVQEITEEDAIKEGICVVDNTEDGIYSSPNYPDIHRDIFMYLWDSLNTKRGYGWEVNPWVWVIEFKRVIKDGKRKNQGPETPVQEADRAEVSE